MLKSLYNFVGPFRCSNQADFFKNIEERSIISPTTYFVNSKLSSAFRLFCTESRKIQFSISTRKPTAWNLKIALQGGSEENKEKLEVSFSHARTTRKEQNQRAPSSSPYSLHTDTACNRVCRYPGLQHDCKLPQTRRRRRRRRRFAIWAHWAHHLGFSPLWLIPTLINMRALQLATAIKSNAINKLWNLYTISPPPPRDCFIAGN